VFEGIHQSRNPFVMPERRVAEVKISLEIVHRLAYCFAIGPGWRMLVCVWENGEVIFVKITLGSDESNFELIDEKTIEILRSSVVSH
jgi:hypothetical protein